MDCYINEIQLCINVQSYCTRVAIVKIYLHMSQVMLFIALVVLISHHHMVLCNSQGFIESDDDFDDTGNCSGFSSCITKYSQLESHILNDDDLLRKFTESFFRTGERESQFIKFTYKFKFCSNENGSDDGNYTVNCTSNQVAYIWSESELYLLGVRPLFWLTLFAVNVPETKATIELPCFCTETYIEHLARLTYLVCM